MTAAGSFTLASAQSVVVASVGPVLTGAGLSVVFVGIMKFNAAWFRPGSYGLVTGVTMLLATCGAIIAGSPTAWLLERYSWREVFAVAAVAGVVLSVAVAVVVRNRPPHSLVEAGVPSGGARAGLRTALRRRELWPLLLATVGTNSTFYAFAGLWGVPLLTETRSLSNTVAAAYTTAALAVYGVGCPAIGVWSDRVGSDRRRSEGFSGDVDGLPGRQDANSESRSARACTFAKPLSRRRYRRSVRKPGRLPPPSPPPSEAQESRWGRPFQRPRLVHGWAIAKRTLQ
ncbi:MFS transporter [Nocardia salmonicida]